MIHKIEWIGSGYCQVLARFHSPFGHGGETARSYLSWL